MDKRSWYTLMVFGAIILIAVSFLAGIAVNNLYHPVRAVTENVTVYVDRWHEPEVITEYVAVNNTVIEYVELPPEIITEYVTVNQTLDGWDSVEEFESWLAEDKTDELLLFTPEREFDNLCFLYSARIRLNAEKMGKYVSWEMLSPMDYEAIYHEPSDGYWHSVISVSINQEIHLYDPKTDEKLPIILDWWN